MKAFGPPQHPRLGDGAAPRVRQGRAFGVGITISAVLHAIAIAFYGAAWGPMPGSLGSGVVTDPLTDLTGTELLVLLETPAPDPIPVEEPPPPPPRPPTVEDEPIPEAVPEFAVGPDSPIVEAVVAPGPDAPPGPPEVEVEPGPGLTLAQRLQPQAGDPRIFAPFGAAQVEPTEEERAQIMLNALLQDFNDSVAVAEAVANRAMDWTYTDDDGGRWGIASGRLYVGDYSIPLPSLNIAPNRLANARQQWMLDDLARGAASAETRQIQGDRVRMIEQRYEEERARAREEPQAAPPPTQDPR